MKQDPIEELAALQRRYPRLFESMVTTASHAIVPANPESYSMTEWSDGSNRWSGDHVQRMSDLLGGNMLEILKLGLGAAKQ